MITLLCTKVTLISVPPSYVVKQIFCHAIMRISGYLWVQRVQLLSLCQQSLGVALWYQHLLVVTSKEGEA